MTHRVNTSPKKFEQYCTEEEATMKAGRGIVGLRLWCLDYEFGSQFSLLALYCVRGSPKDCTYKAIANDTESMSTSHR